MATPFKPKNMSLVVIQNDGLVIENDDFSTEIATIKDFASGYDVTDIARVLIIDPFKDQPYDGPQTVKDVTAAVISWWLVDTDIAEWDRKHGCPKNIPWRVWDALVDEAEEAAEEEVDRYSADDGDYKYQAWKDNQEDAA